MPAQIVITGATVHTLDTQRPTASAIAIEDGRIVAVGDDASVREHIDRRTRHVDGTGLTVTPGLVDSHMHPFWGAETTQGIDLTAVRTPDELRAAVERGARDLPPDGWVRGWGMTYEPFEGGGIHYDVFDAVTGGRPAFLGFFDCHGGVANAAALARGGVTGPVQFDVTSEVVCDEQGRPTGELREMPAMALVRSHIPEPTEEERFALYSEAIRRLNAVGLTGLHGMDGTPESFALLRALEEHGVLSIRMNIPLWQKPDTPVDEMEAQLPLRDERGRRWTGGTAKFFLDGVIETGTAWLLEPDAFGENTEPYCPDPDAYTRAVRLFAAAGFRCTTHCVGDGAVRWALDAYAPVPPPVGHHRIEHIEQVSPTDVPRFAELGVAASMQPLHMAGVRTDGQDLRSRRLGPARMARDFATRDLLRAGAILALGSDWPVADFDPRIDMAYAILRRAPGTPVEAALAPDQAMTMREVLEGYTIAPARLAGEDSEAGRVAPGYRSDLTIFGADPLAIDPHELPQLPIAMTIVDGEVVYEATG